MPWFRWKKRKHEQETEAPAATAASPEAPPAEPTTPDTATDGPSADGETETEAAKRRRRRGTRGGRGRKKPGDAGAAAETPERPAAAQKQQKQQKQPDAAKERERRGERRSDRADRGRSSTRRRQPPRRAPLPAAKRELLISVDVGEQRVAILEDDRVAEVYLERPERRSIAGNIYLGTVDNVLPGMEAAFVEIGLEKNGFLYVDEIVVPELEGKRHGKKIQDLISRGQTIMVQAVKDPMKTKGARLTTEISLPGRFLVYVPNGEGLGVSRRLDDNERQRLKDVIKEIAPKEGGIIVRTAADGASAEDVERDLVFLQRLWKQIQTRAKGAKAPALLYQEAELPLRIVRDLFAGDFGAAQIDHERTYKRIVGYLKKTSPHMLERVHRYKEKTPLFEASGVEAEIRSTLNRRVDLPSGGYLIFDYAEAFTVIDVNTGRFVGSRSKTSNARLEDTIVKNNLEAVKEVVRQLRLRDIGGIIVIDFIDMANPKNREAVEEALRSELERDRTKTYVVEISPLGLVEMTRQNVTDGPREILAKKCPTCAGDGIVVSERTYAMDVERRLRELAAGSRAQAYRVELHPRIAALLIGPGAARLAEVEAAARRRFYLVGAQANGHVHLDHFKVVAEGKREALAPEAPVQEEQKLDLKLVEVDRHDPQAAVGKVDGVDVVVAGAASMVGKKAKVTVTRVLDGVVYATLAATGKAVAEPITFESEAEKPTRAPSRARKAAAPAEVADEEPTAEAEDAEEAEAEAEPADAVAAAADEEETVEADGAAPRKRARRGTRGGRNRRKKPAAAEAAGDESAAEEPDAEVDEEPTPAAATKPARPRRTPKIHVPAAGLDGESAREANGRPEPAPEARTPADAGEPEPEPVGDELEAADGADGAERRKKKTRRGTRGGRNRRKKPVVEANGDGRAAGDETTAEAQVERAGAVEPVGADEQVGDARPPAEAQPVEAVVAAEPDAEGAADADFGYVPMSEWIEDIDR